MSDLDKEFEVAAAEINAKIKEAATALREANDLAKKAGLPALIHTQWTDDNFDVDDLDDEELEKLEADPEWDGESSPLKMKMDKIDVSDLESAIAHGGWSTSSSYC